MCGICGKLDGNSLCRKCEKMLQVHQKTEILEIESQTCQKIELMYGFYYETIIRNMLLQFKFQEKPYVAKTFVNFLLNQSNIFEKIQNYDIIIPVPVSSKRKKQRGYNQSLLLAKQIQRKTGQKVQKNCLVKTKEIIEQSKLNKQQRQNNIQGVYQLQNKQILTNKKILLIDDIYTTGATTQECCRVLQQASPKKIGIFVIAKD